MTKNLNKDIFNIAYKHLNLPTKIMFERAVIGVSKNISYFYDATGVKLKKTVSPGMAKDLNGNTIPFPQNHTQYDGSFIYEYAGAANPELKFFSHPEGYFEPTGTSTLGEMERDYVYQCKDHSCLRRLTEVRRDGEEGTVRLSYKDSNNNGFVSSSEIVEENNYYPFGLKRIDGNQLNVSLPGTLSAIVHTHQNGDYSSRVFSVGGGGLLASDRVQSERLNVPTYMSNGWGDVRREGFHLSDYRKGEQGKIVARNIEGAKHSRF